MVDRKYQRKAELEPRYPKGYWHEGPGSRHSNTYEKEQRDREIWALVLDGYSDSAIARAYGFSTGAWVANIRKRYLAELPPIPAEEWRQRELDRLDRHQILLQRRIEQAFIDGRDDTLQKLISTQLRVQESRRKLLGLDQPEKIHVETVEKTVLDQEYERLLQDLANHDQS